MNRVSDRWKFLLLLTGQLIISGALNAQTVLPSGADPVIDDRQSAASDVVETAVADLSFLLSLYEGSATGSGLRRQLRDDYFPLFDQMVISNQVFRGVNLTVDRSQSDYLDCLAGLTFFSAHLDVIAPEGGESKFFTVERGVVSAGQSNVTSVKVIISRGEDKFQLTYRLVDRSEDDIDQNAVWRIVDLVSGSGSLLSSMKVRISDVYDRAVSLDANPYRHVVQALLNDNKEKQVDSNQWCQPVADRALGESAADTTDEVDRNDLYEVKTAFSGEPYDIYVEVTPDGTVLYQDDIILGADGDVAQAVSGLDFSRLRLWSNATVPYIIDESVSDRALVLRAMQEWSDKTPVQFTEANESHKNILIFTDGDGCRSSIGMIGGRQYIVLDSQCTYGTVLHEIGHTLGLIHEHNRDIRDQYISVKLRNVLHNKERNFYKHPAGHPVSDAYCYGSIMHYSEYAFSMSPALKTIQVKGGSKVGQRKQLSSCDVGRVRKLYQSLAKDSKPGAAERETAELEAAGGKK